MELSPRLKKIADLIQDNSSLADIGTDHAYLPIYCLQNKNLKKAIAMDINCGPLKIAEENVSKYKLNSKIELRLSDGIEKLGKNEVNVLVIAGMGGLLIKSILESGKNVLTENLKIILQPMIAIEELRQYLYENDFCIENEYLAAEGSKMYNIITVRYGQKSDFDYNDIVIGRNLKTNSPQYYKKYLEHKICICEKIIFGLEKAVIKDKKLIKKHKQDLEIFRKEMTIYEG